MKMQSLVQSKRHDRSGLSLVEMMIAMGIGSVLILAVMQISMFTARSFAALGNYADLDRLSRSALDQMSREIREGKIYEVSSQRLAFTNLDGSYFAYRYNPTAKTVTRISGPGPANITSSKVLLTGCDHFKYGVYLRNPTNQFWFPYEATGQEGNTKLIDLSWKCSRRVLQQYNTESVQTAKIVLRN